MAQPERLSDKLRLIADHLDLLRHDITMGPSSGAMEVQRLLSLCLERIQENGAVARSEVRATGRCHLLDRLRIDATMQILSFLDMVALLRFASTCWALTRLVNKADYIWKILAEHAFPLWFSIVKLNPKPSLSDNSSPWRRMYIDRVLADEQWRQPLRAPPLVKRFMRGIHSLYFDRDTLLIGSGNWNEVLAFDLKTGRPHSGAGGIGMFGHSQAVTGLRPLKSNPNMLITSSLDTTLRLFNRSTLQLLKVYAGHTDKVWCVDVHQDRVFSGSSDKTIRVWDLESTESVCEPLRSHRTSISAIRVVTSLTAPLLLTGSAGNTIRVWDIGESTPRCIEKLRGHTRGVFSLQYTPSVLMSGSLDNVIKVWDPKQGFRMIYDLRIKDEHGHELIAYAEDADTNIGVITFQCDDTKVVAGGPDRIVRIWDLRMRRIVNEFEGHAHWITTLQFDENKIVTGSRDKTVRFWDMSGNMLDEISPTFHDPADDNVQLPPANLGLPAAPPLPPPAAAT
jgi:hypothetical protein